MRAYVPPIGERRPRHRLEDPELVLVFDFETRIDPSQRLTFGSYRVYRSTDRLVQEGLVYADDLPPVDLGVLERYVHDYADDRGGRLRLMSRTDFVNAVLWPIGYEARALIVGYNLPFDLSRLAVGWRPAREGGITLKLWQTVSADGEVRDHRWRPEIRVRALDPRRQFIEFTGPMKLDANNRVLLGDGTGAWAFYRGRFLDLHTLAFALTDRNLSLDAAAGVFKLAERKDVVEQHGEVTEAYVDYNRQDVHLTWQLFVALRTEWDLHPIDLDPEQAMSPAGIAKGYLRAAGISPPLARATAIDPLVHGRFMVAYLGGRSEERVRRVPLPCVYTDFSSMYVTTFSLLGFDRWLAADSFETYDATGAARRVLHEADRERLLEPTFWGDLAGVVCRVRPAGELLPARSRWDADPEDDAGAWTIGLNAITADQDIWFALPDLIVAKLHCRAPEILEAIGVRAVGTAPTLRPVELRGEVTVDPRHRDLFRTAIEERALLKARQGTHDLQQFLKTFANSGAYGIFAEYRALAPKPQSVAVNTR